jgi:hypothetical protein
VVSLSRVAVLAMEILESAGNKVASKATKYCVHCPARQSKPWAMAGKGSKQSLSCFRKI